MLVPQVANREKARLFPAAHRNLCVKRKIEATQFHLG
jgi:hypothetical protein